MKSKIIMVVTMLAIAGFLTSCGGDDPKSAEAKKKERLKIWPTGYENMTEEQVEQEEKAAQTAGEPEGDGL